MEILFIGVANTEEALVESQNKYYNGKAQVRPQQYFDMKLAMGLSKRCNVTTMSLPPVASYPTSSCLFYNRKKEVISKELEINYISLLNLPIIKTITIMIRVFLYSFFFLVKKRKNNPIIVCGYISFDTSLPAIIVAKILRKKIFAIVPDVPLFINTYSKVKNPIKRLMNKFSNKLTCEIENRFNGYIFFTQAMNELINRNKQPYFVMEGMLDEEEIFQSDEIEINNIPKVIMYAGTLHEKFGIKKLVEAFIKADLPECQLWIYGDGDYVEALSKIENKNIKFKGSVSKSEILILERKATLLINPRPSSEEFTEYSFPSKTLEYMASGTPLLTTSLSGIPKEYDNYLYYFDGETINDMADKLKQIMGFSVEELNNFGLNSKNFVIKNKTSLIQTKKIFDFLNQNK